MSKRKKFHFGCQACGAPMKDRRDKTQQPGKEGKAK